MPQSLSARQVTTEYRRAPVVLLPRRTHQLRELEVSLATKIVLCLLRLGRDTVFIKDLHLEILYTLEIVVQQKIGSPIGILRVHHCGRIADLIVLTALDVLRVDHSEGICQQCHDQIDNRLI